MAPSLSPTQWLRWTLSFPNRRAGTLSYPTVALVVKLPNERYGPSSGNTCRAEHPSTAGYANMVAGSGRLPTPHALLVDFQHRGNLRGADPYSDLCQYRWPFSSKLQLPSDRVGRQAVTIYGSQIQLSSRPRPFHWVGLVSESPFGDRWPSSSTDPAPG